MTTPKTDENRERKTVMARKAVKKVKNAVLYDDGLIRISNVRLSYPHLRKAYKGKDDKGEAKFGVKALLPKKTHKAAHDLIEDQIEAILKENKVRALADDKKFLRDGDKSDKPEDEGMWTVSARETRRPPLRDEDREIVDPENADEVFYGGCWGSVLIRPWWQNNDFGKRVNAGLSAVRKSRDDEPFGEGRISDEDVDEAFEDDDDDETPSRGSGGGRSSRGRDYEEDDEDDRPARRRRSRDEDEDEDDRPARRRRRPAEDDDDDL
jgi:hypothetical protein